MSAFTSAEIAYLQSQRLARIATASRTWSQSRSATTRNTKRSTWADTGLPNAKVSGCPAESARGNRHR
jgi:hypothetical protein